MPSMPMLSLPSNAATAKRRGRLPGKEHVENVSAAGFSSLDYFLMASVPVPPEKVPQIPEAQTAVNPEWDKLDKRGAWDFG